MTHKYIQTSLILLIKLTSTKIIGRYLIAEIRSESCSQPQLFNVVREFVKYWYVCEIIISGGTTIFNIIQESVKPRRYIQNSETCRGVWD